MKTITLANEKFVVYKEQKNWSCNCRGKRFYALHHASKETAGWSLLICGNCCKVINECGIECNLSGKMKDLFAAFLKKQHQTVKSFIDKNKHLIEEDQRR